MTEALRVANSQGEMYLSDGSSGATGDEPFSFGTRVGTCSRLQRRESWT